MDLTCDMIYPYISNIFESICQILLDKGKLFYSLSCANANSHQLHITLQSLSLTAKILEYLGFYLKVCLA